MTAPAHWCCTSYGALALVGALATLPLTCTGTHAGDPQFQSWLLRPAIGTQSDGQAGEAIARRETELLP